MGRRGGGEEGAGVGGGHANCQRPRAIEAGRRREARAPWAARGGGSWRAGGRGRRRGESTRGARGGAGLGRAEPARRGGRGGRRGGKSAGSGALSESSDKWASTPRRGSRPLGGSIAQPACAAPRRRVERTGVVRTVATWSCSLSASSGRRERGWHTARRPVRVGQASSFATKWRRGTTSSAPCALSRQAGRVLALCAGSARNRARRSIVARTRSRPGRRASQMKPRLDGGRRSLARPPPPTAAPRMDTPRAPPRRRQRRTAGPDRLQQLPLELLHLVSSRVFSSGRHRPSTVPSPQMARCACARDSNFSLARSWSGSSAARNRKRPPADRLEAAARAPTVAPLQILAQLDLASLLSVTLASRALRAYVLSPSCSVLWLVAVEGEELPELDAALRPVELASLVVGRHCRVRPAVPHSRCLSLEELD